MREHLCRWQMWPKRDRARYIPAQRPARARVDLSLCKGRGTATPIITAPKTWRYWVLGFETFVFVIIYRGRAETKDLELCQSLLSLLEPCCPAERTSKLLSFLLFFFFFETYKSLMVKTFLHFSSTLAGVTPCPNLSCKCRIYFTDACYKFVLPIQPVYCLEWEWTHFGIAVVVLIYYCSSSCCYCYFYFYFCYYCYYFVSVCASVQSCHDISESLKNLDQYPLHPCTNESWILFMDKPPTTPQLLQLVTHHNWIRAAKISFSAL